MSSVNRTAKAAQYYVDLGWHLFPVWARSKQPVWSNGYKDAMPSAAHWQSNPDANIGLACGMSGLIALDYDPAKSDDAGRDLAESLLERHVTTTQLTPSGGYHLLYRLPEGVELSNSPGSLPAGWDVRVNGYILLAPSRVVYRGDDALVKQVEDGHEGRYEWVDERWPHQCVPANLPEHVLALLKVKRERQAAPSTNGVYTPSESRASAYARSALNKELDTLARTGPGKRNDQLNISAYSLGQLVAGGALDEWEVRGKLEATALAIGLDEREIQRTIESGLGDGKEHPRSAPEAPRLFYRHNGNGPVCPEDDPIHLFEYRAEDGGILDAWMDHYSAQWLFATGLESWYRWNGSYWQQDDMLMMHRQVQAIMDRMNVQARKARSDAKAEGDDEKEAIAKSYIAATKRTKSRVGSVEGMAQQQRATAAASLDAGNLLNLQNGTLDLDSLEFHDHHESDLLTYCLPYEYDYTAGCARFRQFIREVLVKEDGKTPDAELGLLAQELVGYSLTNDTRQEVMVWLSGEGGNGKTVAITMISKLLGPLAVNMDFQTIGMAGNYDLASLPGKRVVFSTESERGGYMAEGYIKRIVSGEMITARAIYGKPFSFQSTAKIWWAMNDRPTVKDTSNAISRRLKLIPFLRTFSDSDKDTQLIAKLTAELPGILNWAIEGLVRLRKQGRFTQAQAVGAAIEEFKYESNPVAQWLGEQTRPGGETLATAAFQNYALWCTRSNNKELNSTNFGRELTRLNVHKAKKRNGWVYGFSLASD